MCKWVQPNRRIPICKPFGPQIYSLHTSCTQEHDLSTHLPRKPVLSLHACNCCTVLQPSVNDFPLPTAPHAMTAHPCLWHPREQSGSSVDCASILFHAQERQEGQWKRTFSSSMLRSAVPSLDQEASPGGTALDKRLDASREEMPSCRLGLRRICSR